MDWEFASSRSNPSFFTFSGSWDASAYRTIAEHGYPTDLPRTPAGTVDQNVWAFLPLYPAIVGGIAALTGLDFYIVGPLVSMACGAGATLVLGLLLRPRVGASRARWACALFALGPPAFILQVSYAESLFLLLTFLSLWAISHDRFLLAGLAGVAAAFVRPGALALSLTIALVVASGFLRDRARWAWPRCVSAALAGLAIAVAGFSWPLIADAVTGQHGAYFASELAFWRSLIGDVPFIPLTPWFMFAQTYLPVVGPVAVIAILALVALWLLRPAQRELGPPIRAYVLSYALYLFAVFLPQQSTVRLLMPLAPALGDRALRPSTATGRALVLGACAAAQGAMIVGLWFLSFP